MIQVNIFEQLMTFFKIFSSNSYVVILSIASIIALFILLLANKFKNKKITKILIISVYTLIFGTLIYFYHGEILKLLDYLMDNIFLFLFFPNLAVYVLVLIVINIIIIKSTFSEYSNKLTSILNIVFFILFNVIFYLIIDNIIKNNINVYEQLSIYTNNDLLILIELSMKLFITWILLLIIIKISSSVTNQVMLRKTTNKNLILEEVSNQEELEALKTMPDYLEINPTNIEDDYQKDFNYKEIFGDINYSNLKVENVSNESNYNIYNDYLDMIPIKKNIKESNLIETPSVIQEEIVPTVNNIELEPSVNLQEEFINNISNDYQEEIDNNYQIEDIIQKPYCGNSFSAFNIVDSNNTNYLTIENDDNYLEDYESSFDDFKNIQDSDMNLLFDDNTSYLKNIVSDIEKLKNNQDDKNQIKKIYDDIKLNQKDLTLRDYNNLIDMLLSVKK